MLRTALRNVLAHKARLVMTALAVMFGVAFVSGTLVFGDTVGGALRGASAKNLDGVAVSVGYDPPPGAETEPGKTRTPLDDALAAKIRSLPGAGSVRPSVNGHAALSAKDGKPLGADTPWQNLAANYAPGKDGKDPRYPLERGRGPAAAGEMALDAQTAEQAGYRVGDTVRFATTGPTLKKKLVGLVATDDPRVTAGGTLALFDTASAQRMFVSPGHYDEIVIGARPGTDQTRLAADVTALLPKQGATVSTGAALAQEQAAQTEQSTKALTQALLVFAGVALFVGVFIIANTFTMLIAQRTREIALLRAVGASRRQVVRSVLVEAGLLGLAASAAGFVLGLGIATALVPLVNSTGAGLPSGPLVITPGTVLAALLVGVVVTVLAAWLPSRKAARIAPVEAMSSVDAPPAVRGLVLRNVLGTLSAAVGLLLMGYVSTLEKTDSADLLTALFGAGLFMLGLIMLAPLLSRPVVGLAGRITAAAFGVCGKLAKENALRNPRRTAATASALMIGLSLITGLTVSVNSAQRAVAAEATAGNAADYRITNSSIDSIEEGLATDTLDKVEKVPGVSTAAPLASAPLEIGSGSGIVNGAGIKALAPVTDLHFTHGSLGAIGPGEIAVSQKFAKAGGLAVGDMAKGRIGSTFAPGGAKPVTFKVVGIYEANRTVGDALGTLDDVLPYATGRNLDTVLVKAATADRELASELRATLGNSPLLKVQDKDQIIAAETGDVDTVLNMMYGLLGMAVLIAVLGVINTLAMSVFERTREIGLLRAIGLDRAGIRRMVRLESIVICLFGAVLGIGSGVFLAWLNSGVAGGNLDTYETILPWARLTLFALLSIAIGLLAAIWPAQRAARLNVLRAINAQ